MSADQDEDRMPRVLSATLDIDGHSCGGHKSQPQSRRNSTSSAKSWSSGKKYRAPEPPLASSRRSPSPISVKSRKLKYSTSVKEKVLVFWSSEKNRRQCYLWGGFFLLLLSFTIAAVIFVRKLTSGFGALTVTDNSYIKEFEEVDDNYLFGQERDSVPQLRSEKPSWKRKPSGEKVLLTAGGHVINGSDKTVQVLHGQGSVCNFPDGFPAFMPNARIGHVLQSSDERGEVYMCGGFSPGSNLQKIRNQNNDCYVLDLKKNEWSPLPPLMVGVSYASSAFYRDELVVIGGFKEGPERSKANEIQVLDVTNLRWRVSGSKYPIEVWGQCTTTTEDGSGLVSTGGWSDSDPERNLRLTFVQRNKIDSQWGKVADLNIGRATHACIGTSYKGESSAIVVAGGMLIDNSPTASVEVFLASQNAWITLPDMLRPRSWYPSLAILSKKLICLGGKGVSEETEALEVYHSGQRKWKFSSSTAARIAAGRNDARSTVLEADDAFLGCIK